MTRGMALLIAWNAGPAMGATDLVTCPNAFHRVPAPLPATTVLSKRPYNPRARLRCATTSPILQSLTALGFDQSSSDMLWTTSVSRSSSDSATVRTLLGATVSCTGSGLVSCPVVMVLHSSYPVGIR